MEILKKQQPNNRNTLNCKLNFPLRTFSQTPHVIILLIVTVRCTLETNSNSCRLRQLCSRNYNDRMSN